jgi:fatty-acyl-CoA synthase
MADAARSQKPNKLRFSTLTRTVIGGSACPPAMIDAFREDYGVEVLHAWGMTEMSPLGTLCTLKNKHLTMPADEQMKIRLKQGRAVYGVDMKIIGDDGEQLPWDGKSPGDLYVKGPWIVGEYFKGEGGNPLVDGWFPPATWRPSMPMATCRSPIAARTVIKSGGEWISSIDIENIAVAHPAVAMAACIGMRHPKWDERPIVAVVKKPGAEVTREELLKFYEGKTAKWQIPTTWCSSMRSRWARPARCSRRACARCSRTTSCPGAESRTGACHIGDRNALP